MANSIVKSTGTIFLVSISSYFTFLTGGKFLKMGNVRAKLESMGYLTSFSIKKNQFLKWKQVFRRYKDEISKFIDLKNDSSENVGAYMLKQWCYKSLNAEYKKYADVTSIKKYCLMSNRDRILEEDNVEFIAHTEKFQNHQEFLRTENISNPEELKKWCSSALDRNFSLTDSMSFQKIRNLCTSVHSIY